MSRRATGYALLFSAIAFALVLHGHMPRRQPQRSHSTWYMGGRR